ncbi:Regulatory protein LuxO [Pseudobythopirellula maris]|uniref:Regulatory protein LuxO n=1 Tax=Pseudobythopirellula maris TaxID=2527991 RepID=A0A5C5ZGA3_9BACT|nr:sigma 54-interacting transcriptional regulator [Pseudobythopirellula maris]TWT86246.1 Regulatory protein LuxO [Pseudobythopirellula maris]
MYAFLTILTGPRAGAHFSLVGESENLLGRGSDCQVTVADPLSSRVHARLVHEGGQWLIRDNASRNGTYVNGQKALEAALEDGHKIRIGSTEFEFHESEEPPTAEGDDPQLTQTLVQEAAVLEGGIQESSLDGMPNAEQVKELMLLYQLSIRLLGCHEPERVVQIALELLRDRTGSAVVGFLWVTDDGKLRLKRVLPPDAAGRVVLNESLTELVSRQGHAVWVANQESREDDKDPSASDSDIGRFADAICAPLVGKTADGVRETHGALHAYLEDRRFHQSDFDFAISVANILEIALARALEQSSLQTSFERLVQFSPGYDDLIGESEPMLALKAKLPRVAKASGCVLVRGESGSGKEVVARAIQRAGPRAERPLVAVNCAAIPPDLMDSQLFGHKAGSFTGADRDHTGYFQQADLGTLFLDEVGELSLEGQAKLLRVLEGHPFLPVGATEPVSVDVRVIAATNQDLQTYVREKRFREDLYYRLSVFELQLPPLRERGDDIDRLVDFFFEHYRAQHGRPGIKLGKAARTQLRAYRWPGNVRQLRNVIDSAVVMADGAEILPADLALRDAGAEDFDTLEIEQWEQKLIRRALDQTGGSVPEAAKLLGIGRATLYRKIEQHKIER